MKIQLFVYGTLKKSFDNNDILEDAKYIADVKTVDTFAMFVDTSGYYPYLLKELKLNQIVGELYAIESRELLDKIDMFEGVPDEYIRESIIVKTPFGLEKADAYFRKEQQIPTNEKSIEEWSLNNDYFLKAFESYADKDLSNANTS